MAVAVQELMGSPKFESQCYYILYAVPDCSTTAIKKLSAECWVELAPEHVQWSTTLVGICLMNKQVRLALFKGGDDLAHAIP